MDDVDPFEDFGQIFQDQQQNEEKKKRRYENNNNNNNFRPKTATISNNRNRISGSLQNTTVFSCNNSNRNLIIENNNNHHNQTEASSNDNSNSNSNSNSNNNNSKAKDVFKFNNNFQLQQQKLQDEQQKQQQQQQQLLETLSEVSEELSLDWQDHSIYDQASPSSIIVDRHEQQNHDAPADYKVREEDDNYEKEEEEESPTPLAASGLVNLVSDFSTSEDGDADADADDQDDSDYKRKEEEGEGEEEVVSENESEQIIMLDVDGKSGSNKGEIKESPLLQRLDKDEDDDKKIKVVRSKAVEKEFEENGEKFVKLAKVVDIPLGHNNNKLTINEKNYKMRKQTDFINVQSKTSNFNTKQNNSSSFTIHNMNSHSSSELDEDQDEDENNCNVVRVKENKRVIVEEVDENDNSKIDLVSVDRFFELFGDNLIRKLEKRLVNSLLDNLMAKLTEIDIKVMNKNEKTLSNNNNNNNEEEKEENSILLATHSIRKKKLSNKKEEDKRSSSMTKIDNKTNMMKSTTLDEYKKIAEQYEIFLSNINNNSIYKDNKLQFNSNINNNNQKIQRNKSKFQDKNEEFCSKLTTTTTTNDVRKERKLSSSSSSSSSSLLPKNDERNELKRTIYKISSELNDDENDDQNERASTLNKLKFYKLDGVPLSKQNNGIKTRKNFVNDDDDDDDNHNNNNNKNNLLTNHKTTCSKNEKIKFKNQNFIEEINKNKNISILSNNEEGKEFKSLLDYYENRLRKFNGLILINSMESKFLSANDIYNNENELFYDENFKIEQEEEKIFKKNFFNSYYKSIMKNINGESPEVENMLTKLNGNFSQFYFPKKNANYLNNNNNNYYYNYYNSNDSYIYDGIKFKRKANSILSSIQYARRQLDNRIKYLNQRSIILLNSNTTTS